MATTQTSETEPVTVPPAWSASDLPAALLAGMRPKQWTKNLFVYVALVFTNGVPTSFADSERWHTFAISTAAVLLYCLVSGSVYLANDVLDRELDAAHPEKRRRPVASGRLPWQAALAAAVVFGPGGVALAFAFNDRFGLITLAYLSLQIAYMLLLKHIVLLDVFAIALGFVMRAVAGGFAINVSITVWLLVCTFQLALFLGFGKRRHEITSLEDDAGKHRPILEEYSVAFIDQMIAVVLSGLTVSYALYTIASPTALAHRALVMTLPCVMYGIFRYLYLIHVLHEGGAPETILARDRATQINMLLWVVAVTLAMKMG
jgi:4-hydroxybenzoate polyprenyltransferase